MDIAKTVCSLMGACAFGLNMVPLTVRRRVDEALRRLWENLFSTADPFAYIEIPCTSNNPLLMTENSHGTHHTPAPHHLYSGNSDLPNPFYEDVSLYLSSLNIELQSKRVSVFGNPKLGLNNNPNLSTSPNCNPPYVFGLPLNQTLVDTFHGAQLWWTHTADPSQAGHITSGGGRSDGNPHNVFILTMLNSDKPRLLRPYLSVISKYAQDMRRRNTVLTLHTNSRHGSHWTPYVFNHPSTFESIALEDDLAERIQSDLTSFSESEEFYHSVGRAWKRGYLLYGPPGTGKSSLIAAIANFMHYDVYDLELTNVYSNTELKQLLMQTKRKSIIVIEDIDCAIGNELLEGQDATASHNNQEASPSKYDTELDERVTFTHKQMNGLTLSGLLNFADGLQSCFGEERIFIFTTNHKERLDGALLRSGRMDMHILLSYCSFSAFKKLAFNYLRIQEHELFDQLEEAMEPVVTITPASVAEILIRNRKDPKIAISLVLAAVKAAKIMNYQSGEVQHGIGENAKLDTHK